MLRSVNNINGFKILATDGEVGKVDEFYFDDSSWTIRYLIADTGNWLISDLVLISTNALLAPKWNEKLFPVNLSKKEIEDSPKIETDKPVSRQFETDLINYYGWPNYWTGIEGPVIGAAVVPLPEETELDKSGKEKKWDPNLRSTNEVINYNIDSENGSIGHIEDFITDDNDWKIRYIIVDTRNWLPGGKKIILSVNWIEKIIWEESKVKVRLTKSEIKNSPEYNPGENISRDYEKDLYKHYNKTGYWK